MWVIIAHCLHIYFFTYSHKGWKKSWIQWNIDMRIYLEDGTEVDESEYLTLDITKNKLQILFDAEIEKRNEVMCLNMQLEFKLRFEIWRT